MSNQATANLSVGIKTDKARQDLLELKRWLQTEMRSVMVSIDPASIDRSISGYLKQRTFKISVNTKALSAEIQNDVGVALDRAMGKRRDLAWNQAALQGGLKAALEGSFGQRRRVNFDANTLGTELRSVLATAFAESHKVNIDALHLRAQVQAAMTGVNAVIGADAGPGAAASAMGPAVGLAIRQALTPAVDELAKAAAVIGGSARGATKAAKGEPTATQSRSANLPDGQRVTVRQGVDVQQAALTIDRTLKDQSFERMATESSRETFRARRAARRYDERQQREAAAFGPDRSVYDAALKAEREAQATFQSELEKIQTDSSRETLRARRLARQADEKAQRDAAAFGPDRSVYEAKLKAEREAESAFRTGLEKIQTDSSRETLRARRIAAQSAARQRAEEMRRVFNEAKFNAAPDFTARGASIAGASALVNRFGQTEAGMQQVRKFLKNDELLASIGALENHRKKVGEVAASHLSLRNTMNEAHSAARGLAGSMGQMWLTWGSTVPLVAGAAIGASLMSVLKVGKDLEYQLTFVKGLTGETAVSIQELGSAIKSSTATPLEAAAGLRALAQNGLNTAQALQALPTVLNLAAVGEMAVGEAALGATGVLAAFNLEVSELGRVGDVFAKAAAISNTSVAGMVEAMKQASTVSDSFGVGLEETAAALSVLAKRNIEGSAAGTAFRNMLTELASPTRKARDTMKQLGIEVFDSNNQIKPLTAILESLRGALAGLNQEGRLNALKALFDERGVKSANALLSDFALFGENLDTLKNKAEGFTTSVSSMLKETLEGKLKGALADFQAVSASVFMETSSGLKNLADDLRAFVNSDELREGLKAIADGFVSLTRYVSENGTVILATVGAWVGLRAAMAIGGLIQGAITGLAALNAALAGTRVAALGVTGALTGGLALVAALAAEYLLLSRNTDEARESTEQYLKAMGRQADTAEDSLRKMRQENDVLALRVKLLKEGKSWKEAEEQAEAARRPEAADTYMANVARTRARIATNQQKLKRLDPNGTFVDPDSASGRKISQLQLAIEADQRLLLKQQKEYETESLRIKEAGAAARTETSKRESGAERLALEKRRLEYNETVKLANEKLKSGKKLPTLSAEESAGLDNVALKAKLDDLVQEKNRTLSNFKVPERGGDGGFNRTVSDTMRGIRDEQAELKESVSHWTAYNKAKYSTDLYGPVVAEEVQRLTAESDIAQVLAQQVTQKAKLEALRKEAGGDEKKLDHLDSEIRGLEASNKLLTLKLANLREITAVEAANKADKEAADFNKGLAGFQSEVNKQVETTNRSYDVKVQRPEDVAAAKAEAAVREAARSRELDLQSRLDLLEQGRLRLLSEREEIERRLSTTTSMAQIEQLLTQLSLNTTLVQAQAAGETVLQGQLDKLRGITAEEAKRAGQNARSQDLRSQTAEFGMEKFWENYKSGAMNAAQQVEQVMKTSLGGLEGLLTTFATTGKLKFGDFARGVLVEIGKIMTSRLVLQFIAMIGSMFGGSSSSSSSSPYALNTSGVRFSAPVGSANGNIMTSEGALPLRKYATGGIARTPQLSLFGEGRLPEAYVPLPDGRTIPVTMSGGGGGATQVNITVQVASDGKSSVEADTSGNKAAEMGKMLDQAVLEVIARERRPGGLLYS